MSAQLAVAVNVQKTLTGASNAAKATEAAANIPTPDKPQPAQDKIQPVSAPNATTVPSAAPNATTVPSAAPMPGRSEPVKRRAFRPVQPRGR